MVIAMLDFFPILRVPAIKFGFFDKIIREDVFGATVLYSGDYN